MMPEFATRRASDTHEDCKYWGLTRTECRNHHWRLAEFHLRRMKHFTSESIRHSEMASKAFVVAGYAFVICLAALILRAVMA